jgi:hypothetical protein
MTPKMRRNFEASWPELACRVDKMLRRKKISDARRDDILQETALRLIQMWDRVDPRRAASLAVTIALNLMRDESRRKKGIELVGDVPEIAAPLDVETAGLARVELGRLRLAMDRLSPAQHAALLREIGNGNGRNGTPASEKMLRMRARKKLRRILERVSAPLLLRLRKSADLLHFAGAGSTENLLQGLACIGCLTLGLSVAVPQLSMPQTQLSNPTVADNPAHSVVKEAKPKSLEVARARSATGTAVGARNHLAPAPKQPGSAGDTKLIRPLEPDSPSPEASAATEPAPTTPDLRIDQPESPLDDPGIPEPPTPDPGVAGASAPDDLPSVPKLPSLPAPEEVKLPKIGG